jgi:superfamily II DNA or RNA helicase
VTIELRPYQLEAVAGVRDAYGRGRRRVLFVMPTGSGKTTVFSYITNGAAAKGNRVLLLVHRVELLDQASARLLQMGVRHGLIAAGRSMNLAAPVQLASVQTLARRLHHLPPDHFQLVIVDEAHHATAGTWRNTLGHFSHARVLGVTATAVRTDGRGLGEMFDEMVLGPSSAWLTDQGYLAPSRVFAPPIGFSAKGLRKRMGDFDMKQASEELGGRSIMGDAVSHYRRHLSGQTAIAFCCSVAHAEAVAEAFRGQGVSAASIDGTMDAVTRRGLIEALGRGELKVLTSCSLIGEGVDVPSVAGCILLRPTQSLSLHLQMIGRCLRPQDGKTAVILDHVGNIQRLGHHLDDQDWTLEGVKKKEKEKAPSVKVCPRCFAAMSSQASRCGECGHEFVVEKRQLVTVAGELQEVDRQALARARKREQGSAQTLEQLIQVGHERGMKNPRGWARHVLAARQAKGRFERAYA